MIFFNNVGCIGMCGHGTIGLVVTLAHLGRIGIGTHRIETPVGIVTAKLHDRARVTVSNVRSYRFASKVKLDVPGYGEVVGDVAWGGNWFFLAEARGLAGVRGQHRRTDRVRKPGTSGAEGGAASRGANGAEIDHVEVFGPPSKPRPRQPQLRALSRPRLRPLAVRHRHQRQARVSGRRRQAASPAKSGGRRA